MKRNRLLALAAVLSAACSVQADFTVSGTSFEALTVGESLRPDRDDLGTTASYRYWYSAATQVGVVTNADAFGSYAHARPAQAPAVNEKCFFVSAGLRLYRTIEPNDAQNGPSSFVPVDIGTGLCFDSMVSFQASDSDQVLEPGEKLLVWLKPDGDGYALVVSAGYFPASGAASTEMAQKDYRVTNVSVRPDEWHRLTVKLISDVTDCGARAPGLFVYLDGTLLQYAASEAAGDAGTLIERLNPAAARHYDAATHALFPSFDRTRATVTGVAYEGEGAVDDVFFQREAPSFASETTPFTLKWTDKVSSFSYSCGALSGRKTGLTGAGSMTLDLSEPASLVVSDVTYASGYARGLWRDAAGEAVSGDAFAAAPFESAVVAAEPVMLRADGKDYARFAFLMDDVAAGSVRAELVADVTWTDADSPAVWLRDEVDVTLDLKGHSLSSAADAGFPTVYVEGGSLTLVNTGAAYAGSVDHGNAALFDMLVYVQGGRLTVGGGTGDNGVTLHGGLCVDSYTEGAAAPVVVNKGRFEDGGARWEYGSPGATPAAASFSQRAAARPTPTEIGFYLADFVSTASVVIDVSDGYVTIVPADELPADGTETSPELVLPSDFASGDAGTTLAVTLRGTTSARRYRLYYKDALTDTDWTPAGEWIDGVDGEDVLLSVPKGTGASRFFMLSVSETER